MKMESISSSLSAFKEMLDGQGRDSKDLAAIAISLGSFFAIYKNLRNPMVFCSAAGAFLGNAIAWHRDEKLTNQIASTFAGASFGALSAKFFPETAGKVHQAVMGYLGFTFEASKESSAAVISGDDRNSDVDPDGVEAQGETLELVKTDVTDRPRAINLWGTFLTILAARA